MARAQPPRVGESCRPCSGSWRAARPGHGLALPCWNAPAWPCRRPRARSCWRRMASRPGRPGARPGSAGRLAAASATATSPPPRWAPASPGPPGPVASRPGARWWSRAGRWACSPCAGPPGGRSPAGTWPMWSCWPPVPPWPPTGCASCGCGRASPEQADAAHLSLCAMPMTCAPPLAERRRAEELGEALDALELVYGQRPRLGWRRRGQGRLHRRPPVTGHRLRERGLPGPRRRPGRDPGLACIPPPRPGQDRRAGCSVEQGRAPDRRGVGPDARAPCHRPAHPGGGAAHGRGQGGRLLPPRTLGRGRLPPRASRASRSSPVARVFAVADAFDAITTDRPYQAAAGLDEVLRLRGHRGTQFGPRRRRRHPPGRPWAGWRRSRRPRTAGGRPDVGLSVGMIKCGR